ncbi:hypothetical protein EB118_16795 [bacterium]|nr:hypothetical protein [bacterium]
MLIHNINYNVNWRKFIKGSSFFIPCLDCTAAKNVIRKETKRLQYKVLMKIVIEEGIQGIRVWRI